MEPVERKYQPEADNLDCHRLFLFMPDVGHHTC